MEQLHQVFHVVALIAFFAAIAVAFITLTAPLMFPDQRGRSGAQLRTSILLLVLAGAGLGADWLAHRL